MDDFITVVAVDTGRDSNLANQQHYNNNTNINNNKNIKDSITPKSLNHNNHNNFDSQFVTVLSIGDNPLDLVQQNQVNAVKNNRIHNSLPEEVIVYRLPGERLGFGLKFQGGTKNTEKIQRLYIQSCSVDSPASRVIASWGELSEGDEILEIDNVHVTKMTRLECVKCLKDSNLAIKLLIAHHSGGINNDLLNGNKNELFSDKKTMSIPPPPPPVPPRKLNRRKSQENKNEHIGEVSQPQQLLQSPQRSPQQSTKNYNMDKPFTPPPDAEFYINLFSDENERQLRDTESDDTGSTISTVIENYSLNSNTDLSINSNNCNAMMNGANTINNNTTMANIKSIELAKALKPFTLLEKEFNVVDSSGKLEECLLRLQPPVNFQDINNNVNMNCKNEGDIHIVKVTGADTFNNLNNYNTQNNNEMKYENVMVVTKTTIDDDKHIDNSNGEYENVMISKSNTVFNDLPYENVHVLTKQITTTTTTTTGSNSKLKSPTIVSPTAIPQPIANRTIERNLVNAIPPSSTTTLHDIIDIRVPPTPLPRQAVIIEPKKRTHISMILPSPRKKLNTNTLTIENHSDNVDNNNNSLDNNNNNNVNNRNNDKYLDNHIIEEYSNIKNWLQDTNGKNKNINNSVLNGSANNNISNKTSDDEIHECRLITINDNSHENELPRLIKFLPKTTSLESLTSENLNKFDDRQQSAIVDGKNLITDNNNNNNNNNNGDDENHNSNDNADNMIIKKCIPINSTPHEDSGDDEQYVDSSSDSDMEKSYEPNSVDRKEIEQLNNSGDEEGEKLGPPEFINGPGPSEAYFNFHWQPTMLPTIGEVEEEFSSLEQPQNGPMVIVNSADEPNLKDINYISIAATTNNNDIKKPIAGDDDKTTIEINTSVSQMEKVNGNPISSILSTPSSSPSSSIKITKSITTTSTQPQPSMMMTSSAMTTNNLSIKNVNEMKSTNDKIINNQKINSIRYSADSQNESVGNKINDRNIHDSSVSNKQLPTITSTAKTTSEIITTPTVIVAPPRKSLLIFSPNITSSKNTKPYTSIVTSPTDSVKSEKIKNIINTFNKKETEQIELNLRKSSPPSIAIGKSNKSDENSLISNSIKRLEAVSKKQNSEIDTFEDEESDPNSTMKKSKKNKSKAAKSKKSSNNNNNNNSNNTSKSNNNENDNGNQSKQNDNENKSNAVIYEVEVKEIENNTKIDLVINDKPKSENVDSVDCKYNETKLLNIVMNEKQSETNATEPIIVSNEIIESIIITTSITTTTTDTLSSAPQQNETNVMETVENNLEIIDKSMDDEVESIEKNDHSVLLKSLLNNSIDKDYENNTINKINKEFDNEIVLMNISENNAININNVNINASIDHELIQKENIPKSNHEKVIERIILGTEHELTPQTNNDEVNESQQAPHTDKNNENFNNKINLDHQSAKSSMNIDYNEYLKDSSPTSMDHSISIVPSSIIVNDILLSAPPTFSRLPPDGHEFPPNFSEPIILTAVKQTATETTTTTTITAKPTINKSTIKDDSIYQSAREDPPPLPKSVPPPLTAPRKIYRQDIVINVDDKRPENNENIIPLDDTNVISKKFEWSAAVLEDKSVRKEIMITAKNGNLSKITQSASAAAAHADHLTNAARRRSIENYAAFKKFDTPKRQIGTLPANWRKDEKSEKSVRDKIAMFSNDDDDVIIPLPNNHISEKIVLAPRKSLNKSTENLLSDNYMRTRKIADVNAHTSLAKKAQSVENLDEYNQHQMLHRKSSLNTSNNSIYSNDKYTISVKTSLPLNNNNNSSPTYNINKFVKAYSVDNLNNQNSSSIMKVDNSDNNHHMKYSGNYQSQPIVSATYGTLPRTIKHPPASVSRTTSFSAHGTNGVSYEDRNRRSSVSNILEQRKKSMSKLRGLIIPERTALGEEPNEPVLLDLPEIKNNDVSKAKSYAIYSPYGIHSTVNNNNKHTYLKKSEPVVPNPRHYTSAYQSVISSSTPPPTTPTSTTNTNNYQRIYGATNRTLSSSINKQPNASTILPPVKPPRASLLSASRSSLSDVSPPVHPKLPIDESEDSDSVFSSKISSPPNSPIVNIAPPEKFALTRTLSSETNTSIASSTTSTLTSGSAGSQASCSSVGSTPTIDMSRKINKSSSNESYVNRKNILASAKCRSGKDESLLLMNNGHRQQHHNHDHHHHHNNQQHQQPQHHHQPQQRYDDEDSTDGYDEEECRRHHHPKPKQRNSVAATLNNNNQKMIASQSLLSNNNKNINNIIDLKKPINYKLITNEDNIRDMVINVASYIEVTSDTDADSSKQSDSSLIKQNIRFIDEERRASFKSPVVPKTTKIVVTTTPLVPVRVSKIKNQTPSIVATPRLSERVTPTAVIAQEKLNDSVSENNDLAKWVRNEVAKNNGRIDDKINIDKQQKTAIEIKTFNRSAPVKMSVLENIQKFNKDSSNAELPKIPNNVEVPKTIAGVTRGAPSPAITTESKKNRNNDIRKHSIDTKSNVLNTTNNTPIKSPKDKTSTAASYHERFSSLDSLASSSSGISSTQTSNSTQAINPTLSSNSGESSSHNLQSTPTDFGSFSSFGSNHSLITAADLQLLIEEADPPLKTPEAFVVVLQRESPECSVGVTLAGGSDYEAKEITIHRILTNSPAYKDGRLKKGDRMLSINGLSMRGLTHRESVTVLKTPRQEVVMVITRSESVVVQTLTKTKRSSLGSLSSLNEKPINGNSSETTVIDRRKSYHKTSRSLDLDLDIVSNDAIQDENKSIDGTEESTSSSAGDDAVFGATTNTASDSKVYSQPLSKGSKMVEIYKDSCGLGLAIEGGQDSPNGHQPLIVKKIFMGGAAEKTGKIKVGDIILWINDFSTENMTRVQAWNYMKSLPSGPVKFVFS